MLKWKIYIEDYAKKKTESPEDFVDIYFADQKNIFQRQTKNRIDCIKKGHFYYIWAHHSHVLPNEVIKIPILRFLKT